MLPLFPTTLQYLDCSFNQLSALPSFPPTLEHVCCPFNQLTSLPRFPDSIQIVSCQNNRITSLSSLSKNLTILWCFANKLTSLPLLPVGLRELLCNHNEFPDRTEEESLPAYYVRVCEWEQEKSKERIQVNTRRFKEELMMNRWHPVRLDALLEMGFEVDML